MTNPIKGLSFEALFEVSIDAQLLVDANGRIALSNSAAQFMLGYSKEALNGLVVEALIPLRFREQHIHFRAMFAGEPKQRFMGNRRELLVLRHDETELPVDISLNSLKANQHSYILVTLYSMDRRHHAENALVISEANLYRANQLAGLDVFDIDLNKKTLLWEGSVKSLLGNNVPLEAISEKFSAAIHPDDQESLRMVAEQAKNPNGSGEYNAEYRIINPYNQQVQWISAIGCMLFENEQPVRMVGVAKEITAKKIKEKKIQELRNQAEVMFNQQVAIQTASAIAHELNQPLAAISAYSEVALLAMSSDVFDTNNLKKALEGCVQQSHRAGACLHELMGFLQKGDVIKTSLNINDAVIEAVALANANVSGNFYIITQLEENMPPVEGVRIQVLKILSSLISNSVEAMQSIAPSKSIINIFVRTNKDQNMAHVTVQDSGPGLDHEDAKRIFEPFFTTRKTGIGMGLAVSRKLVEANGGSLWLETNPGHGATFHFTLPFAAQGIVHEPR